MAVLEALFWFAVSVLVYTYLGYPCIVYVLGLRFPRRIEKRPITPKVTILIAAHNEEAGIGAKIENCLALKYPESLLDLVIVSDGSTDQTAAIVAEYADRFPARVKLISLPARRGKANALNVGAAQAHREILLLADVRQRLDADAAHALVANFSDPSVGAVTGELALFDDEISEFQGGLGLYWRIEKKLRSAESHFGSTIVYTGALSAIRRSLFRALPVDVLTDDLVIPLRIMAQGFRVVFEPAAQAVDCISKVPGHEFSRKVRTLAGLFQTILHFRSYVGSIGVRAWWQLISHKVLRLVVPYALVTICVTSVLLSGTFYRITLFAQLSAYGLGVFGLCRPTSAKQSRVTSAAAAFLMLHVAAFIAPIRFLTGARLDLWFRAPTDFLSHA
jgi:poly-beta-1,6-N-acetyl-D-glucosamine synthase